MISPAGVAPSAPFCVDGALAEPLPGTAPHRPVWALVEHPGPWGREAVLDAPWPHDGFGAALQARLDAADVRAVLARRPGTGERGAPARPAVVLARYGGPGDGGWTATTRLDAAPDLLDLDWAVLAVGAAPPAGWADPGPVWGVCTHGTRDACCARLGRPLAQAFAALVPDGTWEISHSGGHRFSGVAFDVTHGRLYGRAAAADAAVLVDAQRAGRTVRHLLRGAVHRSPADQAAEAALRDHLDEDRLDALAPDGDGWRHTDPAGRTTRWRVRATQVPVAPRPASCGKPAEPATAWRVEAIEAA